MTTATLQHQVQRSRFAHHLLGAISSALPAPLRTWMNRREQQPSAAEAAAREAQEVRSLAYSYSRSDPGFAADLYAAAARHEGLYTD